MSINTMNYGMTLEDTYKMFFEGGSAPKLFENEQAKFGTYKPNDIGLILKGFEREDDYSTWNAKPIRGNVSSVYSDGSNLVVKFDKRLEKIGELRTLAENMHFYTQPAVHTNEAIDLYLFNPFKVESEKYAWMSVLEARLDAANSIPGIRLLDKAIAEKII